MSGASVAAGPTRSTTQSTLPLRLAGIVLLVGTLAFMARSAFIDDALIYARYIRNAVHGLGLVYNPGERFNGLTSPLYSYLVLLVAKLAGGHVLAASAAVSAVAFLAACVLAETLVPFAGLLLAGTGYFYALVGMETTLFLCMLLLNFKLLEQHRYHWLPASIVLLILTRFEGAALVPPLLFELHERRRWPSWRAYVPAVVITVGYLLLNHHWYGAFLPSSANAKLGQGRAGYWGHWPFAFYKSMYQLKPHFLPTVYIVAGVALLVIPGLRRLARTSLVRIGLPFLLILLAFYTLFNIPGYVWYYAPFICLAMVYACAGIRARPVWQIVAATLILFSAATALIRYHTAQPGSDQPATRGYRAIAHWIDANGGAHPRLEAAEIGNLGWFCQRCVVIDILGLTYPKNADHIAHRQTDAWLAEDNPDFVVVHYQPWVFEKAVKASPSYERVPVDFGPTVYLLARKHRLAQMR